MSEESKAESKGPKTNDVPQKPVAPAIEISQNSANDNDVIVRTIKK